MPSDHPSQRDSGDSRPWQFSLRTMFVVTTVAAVITAVGKYAVGYEILKGRSGWTCATIVVAMLAMLSLAMIGMLAAPDTNSPPKIRAVVAPVWLGKAFVLLLVVCIAIAVGLQFPRVFSF